MFQKITFSNGLRLITAPLFETGAVTVLVLIRVGSRYEKQNINGVSHFIEHMMFKGTKKRPSTLAISKDLDSVGAEYNAFTSKDHTGYYIKINQEEIELALDILSDMLFHSKFEEEEIEREKGVICEEIKMYEDNPLMYIEDLFEQTLFFDHPLGQRVSGTTDSVKGISKKMMIDYKNKYYQPSNFVIGLAGRFDDRAVRSIEKYFGTRGTKVRGSFSRFEISKKFKESRLEVQFKETEQVELALGFPSYSYFDPRIYALTLLALILGGTMSSRLFISVRERKGLCYFIKSFLNIYEDVGNLVIQAGLDKSRIEFAIRAILKELDKIRSEGVKEQELLRAKECIKGRLILELEDSSALASWYAKQELLVRKILTPEEKLKKISAVTAFDIKRVAQDVIQNKRLCAAIIGPFKNKQPFLKLLKL